MDSWLQQYRVFWQSSLTNLKAFVEAEYAKEILPAWHQAQITLEEKRTGGRVNENDYAMQLQSPLPQPQSLAATVAFAASDAQKSFEQLKGLSGSWEGKASDGKPIQVDYRLTARGRR